ncbi:MAG: hypothetical protein Q9227_006184 [Pyrenula ochraceoflavens]
MSPPIKNDDTAACHTKGSTKGSAKGSVKGSVKESTKGSCRSSASRKPSSKPQEPPRREVTIKLRFSSCFDLLIVPITMCFPTKVEIRRSSPDAPHDHAKIKELYVLRRSSSSGRSHHTASVPSSAKKPKPSATPHTSPIIIQTQTEQRQQCCAQQSKVEPVKEEIKIDVEEARKKRLEELEIEIAVLKKTRDERRSEEKKPEVKPILRRPYTYGYGYGCGSSSDYDREAVYYADEFDFVVRHPRRRW